MPAKATAAPISCARRGRSPMKSQASDDGEEGLHLDDERGEPDRQALMDRDEQQPELPDADQEAIERDRPEAAPSAV